MEYRKTTIVLTSIATGLVCMLVFVRALSFDFLNYDDMDFVLYNPNIRNLDMDMLSYAFTTVPPFSGIWTPLVWASFAVDYHFWGLNPLGYHLTNILIHAVNASLVVLIADKLFMAKSEFSETFLTISSRRYYPAVLLAAGLLFGIHPLRVESVVWISERKDVLNGIFALGSILFYLLYVESNASLLKKSMARRCYFISLLLLLFSFMAKPISVVIPVILLVLDWYPLNRLGRATMRSILIEKIPYFVLSMAMTSLTLYIASSENGMLVSTSLLSFGQRLVISGNAIFEYIRFIVYPVTILPTHLLATPIPFSYTLKTTVIFVVFIYFAITRKPSWLFAAWLCFIIPLLPVLAFFQTNSVAFAARYTYLPSVIPSIAVIAIISAVYEKSTIWRYNRYIREFLTSILIAVLLFHGLLTTRLIGVWKNSETFWTRQITYQPYDKAYFLRAGFYLYDGNYAAAIQDYTVCIEIALQENLDPVTVKNLYAYRGDAFSKAGRYLEAVRDFSTVINFSPD
ncbi:MAG: hypothetical protein PHU01_09585, partial [Desulfuromonadaceae bacterium]|nr:hypothetical protein [Desulfuromonadaceae bacterium]